MIFAGLDLGTNTIRLVTKNGLIFDNRCKVALDRQNHCLAIGEKADRYLGMENDGISVVNPLAIRDIQMDALYVLLEKLWADFSLHHFFQKTILIVSYPSNLSKAQLIDLKDILKSLGIYKIYLKEEIWVAAIGSKLDLFLPSASCILNIGSANCDIATIVSGKIISKRSSHIAGEKISMAINFCLRSEHHIKLSDYAVETIKKTMAHTYVQENPQIMNVRLDDSLNDLDTYFEINENMFVSTIIPYIRHWAKWIKEYISSLSPIYQIDIHQNGIICCGGSVKIKGFSEKLSEEVGFPIYLTENPSNTVCDGLSKIMNFVEND